MTENELSYPIGKYNPPQVIDHDKINRWIEEIAQLPDQLAKAVDGLSDEQLDTPYRPGGWTVRQVIHHVPDSHINSYVRFHWALTENNPQIKAYNEKTWATLGYHQKLPIQVSLSMLDGIHKRWVYLLKSLSNEDLDKTFLHPEDNGTYSLRYTIGNYAWHGKHHLAHIENLKARMGW